MKKKTMTLRHPLFAALLVVSFATGTVWGQEKSLKAAKSAPKAPAEETEDNDTQGGPVEGSAEVVPEKSGGSSTSHTVAKGDTLWDLSQKFLGSPWYWPKVWSYNPEIANPHWIYPGNQVRFIPTGEEVPTQVEVGNGPEEEVEPAQMIDDTDRVQVSGKIGYTPKNGVSVRLEGFVTSKEVEEAGVIAGSFAESQILSFPEQLYVRFKKSAPVKMGEPYVIYRTATQISHPVTGADFGYLTVVLGTAKVVRWSEKEKIATLEIVGDWDEIQRGDLVGPAAENFFKIVAPRPNAKEVKGGYVVSGGRYWFTAYAEHEQMLIDKGSEQGVEVGNVFTIFRQMDSDQHGDPILRPNELDERWPKEDVGSCLAVEVKSKTTTCILTRSMREIVPGDHVELRVRSGGGASASR
jgi:hypothetical protein